MSEQPEPDTTNDNADRIRIILGPPLESVPFDWPGDLYPVSCPIGS